MDNFFFFVIYVALFLSSADLLRSSVSPIPNGSPNPNCVLNGHGSVLNIQNNSQHIHTPSHTPAHTHSHATGHTASLWASALSSTANTAGECVLFSTTYYICVCYITLLLSLAQGFPQTWCCSQCLSRLSVVFCSLGSRLKHTLTHRPPRLDSHQYTNLPVQNISTDMWETSSKLLNCMRRQHF